MLVNVVGISKRESAGQYCTPPNLARLLVELSIKDLTCSVYDPCCGTGTIIKEVQQLKKNQKQDYVKSIWASDKFTYPLKMATISLSDPDITEPIQIFQKDIFELTPGDSIDLVDSKGVPECRNYEPVDVIVSNLPFVRFEEIKKSNPNAKSTLTNKKHDLYADIALTLSPLIKENGRVGLILSNSWMYTEWGVEFKEQLSKTYNIERVVISQIGRWFDNADVVTTILILKKRSPEDRDENKTQYVSVCEMIEDWSNDDLMLRLITDILTNNVNSESAYIHNYSDCTIKNAMNNGLGMMAAFSDITWCDRLDNKLVFASSLFNIARGSRRGWDKLFYPPLDTRIEREFLKPVLLSSKRNKQLTIEADGLAFCCSEGVEYLEKNHFTEARKWIAAFENGVNEVGIPLVKSLERPGLYWYEMSDDETADLVISMNPGARPCVFKFAERSFVNQRLIRLTASENVDVELSHALMNTTLGILMIESQGFGRGLGVLDLNSTRLKKSYRMLNPQIAKSSRKEILDAFEPLLKRSMKELPEELVMEDRIRFDNVVLKAYGLDDIQSQIANTLLEVYHIRDAVHVKHS